MMHRVLTASCWVVALALAACGPRAEREGARAPRATLPLDGKAVQPGAPAVPWAQKSRAERIEFMGIVFHPRMKALFDEESRDADGAPFRCQSCHGENMVDAGYAMPNGLFPLPEASPFDAALAQDEKTARFMAERVVPAARELLGDETLGCHACHAREGKTP